MSAVEELRKAFVLNLMKNPSINVLKGFEKANMLFTTCPPKKTTNTPKIRVMKFSHNSGIIKFHEGFKREQSPARAALLCRSISCETHILYMFSLDGPRFLNHSVFHDPSVCSLESIRPPTRGLNSICFDGNVQSSFSFHKNTVVPFHLASTLSRLVQTIVILTFSPLHCYDFLLTAQLLAHAFMLSLRAFHVFHVFQMNILGIFE